MHKARFLGDIWVPGTWRKEARRGAQKEGREGGLRGAEKVRGPKGGVKGRGEGSGARKGGVKGVKGQGRGGEGVGPWG